MKKCIQEDVR